MAVYKFLIFMAIILPLAASVSLTEEFFLTHQLISIFGEELDDNSSSEMEKIVNDDIKYASLLSPYDTKEKSNHYWTRKGHQGRGRQGSQNASENNFEFNPQRFRKRHVLKKRHSDLEKQTGSLTKDSQNYTSEMPRPIMDYPFRKGL